MKGWEGVGVDGGSGVGGGGGGVGGGVGAAGAALAPLVDVVVGGARRHVARRMAPCASVRAPVRRIYMYVTRIYKILNRIQPDLVCSYFVSVCELYAQT